MVQEALFKCVCFCPFPDTAGLFRAWTFVPIFSATAQVLQNGTEYGVLTVPIADVVQPFGRG